MFSLRSWLSFVVHFPIGFFFSFVLFSNSVIYIAIPSHLFMFLHSFFYHRTALYRKSFLDAFVGCIAVEGTYAFQCMIQLRNVRVLVGLLRLYLLLYFSLSITFSPLKIYRFSCCCYCCCCSLTEHWRLIFCFLFSFFVRSRIVAVRSLATNSSFTSLSKYYIFHL